MLGLLLLLLPVQASPDADSVSSDTVYYGGRLVRYFARTGEVVLLDSAWVRYGDMTVYSDSIHYDTDLQRLRAFGEVLFASGDENIDGVRLEYDIDTRKGMMRTARTELEDGFFRAEEVWLVKEKTINARRAYYTTCELEHPHYDFYGPRAKLLMDDIVIASPVVFRLWGFPVLAAPFWLVPVAAERKSGIMPFKVGYSNEQGWYGKDLAWYQVINDYADATFYLDVMTRKGIQPRAEAVYIVDPFARGSVQGSYITEWDTRRTRYSFNGEHSSVFLFGTELKARADFVSDSRYVPEYGEDEIDWLKQEASSYAELSRRISRVGSFSASVRNERQFLQHRSYSYLPSARFSLGTRPVPFGWTASPSASFDHVIWNYADSADVDTARATELGGRASVGLSSPGYRLGPAGELRIGHSISLSANRDYYNDTLAGRSTSLSNSFSLGTFQRPFGVFRTRQDISVRQDNRLDSAAYPETQYSASAGVEMTLYRVFGLEVADLHGMLHTVRPNLSVTYQPGVVRREFIGTPDLFRPENARVALTINNGFQAKAGSLKTVTDLGNFRLGTSYDVEEGYLAPLAANATLRPFAAFDDIGLQIDAGASFDFDSLDLLDDYSVTTSFRWEHLFGRAPLRHPDTDTTHHPPQRDWRVRLRLNHTLRSTSHMLTGTVSLYVPGWRFDLNSIGYNFETQDLTNYSITVWKDLHCWEALATFDRLGSQWKYDFEVRIKRLPDVKFGKSTFRSFLPE